MRVPPPGRFGFLICLAVAGLAAAVYAGSLANGFTYDDLYIIPNNPAVTGDGGIALIIRSSYWYPDDPHQDLYRPLTIASYWLNYRVAGLAPWSYHLVNVILHGLVSALVWLVLRRVAASAATAAAAAILFATHPIHSEAVASTVGRAELLAALFIVSAWLLRDRIWLAGGLFLLGLLSKENAVVLPLLLLVEDLGPSPAAGSRRLRPSGYLPLIGAFAVFLTMRCWVLGWRIASTGGPFAQTPTLERLMTAVEVLGRYLWLLVWPARLSADYEFNQIPIVTSPADAGFIAGGAAIAACAAAGWMARRRLPDAARGLLILVAALAPFSNLPFGIGVVMAERLLYLPSIGFCLAAAAGLEAAARAAGAVGARRIAATTCALALVPAGLYAARAWRRTLDWMDPITLFEATVRASPRSVLAQFGMGHAYQSAGRLVEAEGAYRRALLIAPRRAETWYNLGTLLEEMGRTGEAIESYRRTVQADPGFARAHGNLGILLQDEGRLKEAEQAFRTAAGMMPAQAGPWYNLGTVLESLGRIEEAIQAYREAIRRDPRDVRSLNNLGWLLVSAGRPDEAVDVLEEGRRIDPEARLVGVNLATALLARGEASRAAGIAAEVLERHPGDASALRILEEASRAGSPAR